MNESDVVVTQSHVPCPDCGSHDALCIYSDGHSYCFSCQTIHRDCEQEDKERELKVSSSDLISPADMSIEPLKKRMITAATCRHMGYYVGSYKGQTVQVANYVDDSGVIVGQEGEIDALTVSQLTGNKFPVVSLPNGCQSARKTFKAQYEWLESFPEVILMFDMDAPGRDAVKSVCDMLTPGKVKIAVLPCKDANECLTTGKAEAVVSAIWNAKPYKPACIVNGQELWDSLSKEDDNAEGYPLPWDIELQEMTMGLRKGELITITAGTGTGKTTFVRQIAHHLGVTLGLRVGMLMLEENVKRTAKGLMSIHVGKRLALNRHAISDEEYHKAFEETLGTGRFVLYEHFGSLEEEDLIRSIRYMAVGSKCDFIILDHISIAISGLDIDNERKATDVLMTKLRSLVEETGVGLLVVSHLKRVDGTPAEEGGVISLSHLRGSQALSQLSDGVWALERNQQSKDSKDKNTVKVRILKGRFTGETGLAGYLKYDKTTDRLVVADEEDYPQDDEDDGGNSPF